jgi:hypothetical protein
LTVPQRHVSSLASAGLPGPPGTTPSRAALDFAWFDPRAAISSPRVARIRSCGFVFQGRPSTHPSCVNDAFDTGFSRNWCRRGIGGDVDARDPTRDDARGPFGPWKPSFMCGARLRRAPINRVLTGMAPIGCLP